MGVAAIYPQLRGSTASLEPIHKRRASLTAEGWNDSKRSLVASGDVMKRFKTWKRWAYVTKGGMSVGLFQDTKWDVHCRVLLESDYRKVMAVYNAAMKYSALPSGAICNKEHIALERACERARK
jgi:hypothetical protein